MQPFNFDQARSDGIADAEIVEAIRDSGQYNYKFDQALADGKDPKEIVDYLKVTPDRFIGMPDIDPVAPINQEGQQAIEAIPGSTMEGTEDMNYPTVDIIKSPETIGDERAQKKESLLGQEATITLEEDLTAEQQFSAQTETDAGSPILDPLTLAIENPIAQGLFKGLGAAANVVKFPKWWKDLTKNWTAKDYEENSHVFNMMEEMGITPTNATIPGKGSQLEPFTNSDNLSATAVAIESQSVFAQKYIETMQQITSKLKNAKIDPTDISSFRNIKPAEDIVVKEVNKFRDAFYKMEGEAYKKVTKTAGSIKDEYKTTDLTNDLSTEMYEAGIPEVAMNAVKKIMSINSRVFKGTPALISADNKAITGIMAKLKANKAAQKAAGTNEKKLNKLIQKQQELKQKLATAKEHKEGLKDIRYMTTTEMLNTRKLINEKIFNSGGIINQEDAMQMRGLKMAITKIDDFLASKVKNPQLQKELSEARAITRTRAAAFSKKSDDKNILNNMLDQDNLGKVTELLSGKNAKENILHIRDTFGKDSEAYNNAFSIYLTNKAGLDVPGMQAMIKDGGISAAGVVDIQKAAEKISTLDSQDFAMIENIMGKKARLDMKAMQKITMNMADIDTAITKYGVGTSRGKLAYIGSGDASKNIITRGFKVVKDATTHYLGRRLSEIVGNQPKFRAGTGAVTGATAYFASAEPEDVTIEAAILSMVTGGVGGYYLGKATRQLLERDINKVARYLKRGTGAPKNMGRDLEAALKRIGDAQGASKITTLRQGLENPPTGGQPGK